MQLPEYTLSYNESYSISVLVSSRLGNRSASASVTVQPILTSLSIDVIILSKVSIINVDSTLSLSSVVTGSISASNPNINAFWSVYSSDDILIPFSTNFYTATSASSVLSPSQLSSGFNFPVVFPPNSFTQGRTYSIRLSLYPALEPNQFIYSEILIVINTPPSNGVINVSPDRGNGLSTTFYISSHNWVSENLPLLYQFSYQVIVSQPKLSLCSLTQLNYVQTFLPPGADWNNQQILLFAQVYDTYNGSTSISTKVIVNVATNLNVTSFLLSNLKQASNSGQFYRLINTVASTVNQLNCTLTIPTYCLSLNRNPCDKYPNTCGFCLSGYKGLVGYANTKCIPKVLTSSIIDSLIYTSDSASLLISTESTCLIDSDCFYGYCNKGICAVPSKVCSTAIIGSSCSGNGECLFYDSANTKVVSCLASNPSCTASCSCYSGFSGVDCSLDPDASKERDSVRSSLCKSISSLSSSQNPSNILLSSLINSLYSSYNPYEVISLSSLNACTLALSQVSLLAMEGYLVGLTSGVVLYLIENLSDFFKGYVLYPPSIVNNYVNIGESIYSSYMNIATGISYTIYELEDPTSYAADSLQSVFVKPLVSSAYNLYNFTAPLSATEAAFGGLASTIQMTSYGLDQCVIYNNYLNLGLSTYSFNLNSTSTDIISSSVNLNWFVSGSGTTVTTSSISGNLDHPAFYLTIQFSSVQNFTYIYSKKSDNNEMSYNYTIPECMVYDATSLSSQSCKSCNILSYTNYNVTYECFDMSLLCPLTTGLYSAVSGNNSSSRTVYGSQFYVETKYVSVSVPTSSPHFHSVDHRNKLNVETICIISAVIFFFIMGTLFFMIRDKYDENIILSKSATRDNGNSAARLSQNQLITRKGTAYFDIQDQFVTMNEEFSNSNPLALKKGEKIQLKDYQSTNSRKSLISDRPESLPSVSYENRAIVDESTLVNDAIPLNKSRIADSKSTDIDNKSKYLKGIMKIDETMHDMASNTYSGYSQRIIDTLKLHHFSVFVSSQISLQLRKTTSWLSLVCKLTLILFINTFILHVFYPDNGYCESLYEESACVTNNNVISSKSTCHWDSHDSVCSLRLPSNDFIVDILIIYVMLLVLVPVDFVFNLIIYKILSKTPDFEGKSWIDWILSCFESSGVNDDKLIDNDMIESVDNETQYVLSKCEEYLKRTYKNGYLNLVDDKKSLKLLIFEYKEAQIKLDSILFALGVKSDRSIEEFRSFDEKSYASQVSTFKQHMLSVLKQSHEIKSYYLSRFGQNDLDNREACIIQSFVLENVPKFDKYCLTQQKYLNFHDTMPGSVNSYMWAGSWVIIAVVVVVLLVYTVIWCSIYSQRTFVVWITNICTMILIEYCFVEVIRLLMVNIVAIDRINPKIMQVYNVLNGVLSKNRIQDQLRPESSEESLNLVQYLSSVCRISKFKAYKDLFSSRILSSLDDYDSYHCRVHPVESPSYLPYVMSYLLLTVPSYLSVINEGLITLYYNVLFTSIIIGFVLLNYALYQISSLVIALPYIIVVGLMLYYASIYLPSKHRYNFLTTRLWRSRADTAEKVDYTDNSISLTTQILNATSAFFYKCSPMYLYQLYVNASGDLSHSKSMTQWLKMNEVNVDASSDLLDSLRLVSHREVDGDSDAPVNAGFKSALNRLDAVDDSNSVIAIHTDTVEMNNLETGIFDSIPDEVKRMCSVSMKLFSDTRSVHINNDNPHVNDDESNQDDVFHMTAQDSILSPISRQVDAPLHVKNNSSKSIFVSDFNILRNKSNSKGLHPVNNELMSPSGKTINAAVTLKRDKSKDNVNKVSQFTEDRADLSIQGKASNPNKSSDIKIYHDMSEVEVSGKDDDVEEGFGFDVIYDTEKKTDKSKFSLKSLFSFGTDKTKSKSSSQLKATSKYSVEKVSVQSSQSVALDDNRGGMGLVDATVIEDAIDTEKTYTYIHIQSISELVLTYKKLQDKQLQSKSEFFRIYQQHCQLMDQTDTSPSLTMTLQITQIPIFSMLTKLVLSNNKIKSFESFRSFNIIFPNLEYLDLSRNLLSDALNFEFSTLSNLSSRSYSLNEDQFTEGDIYGTLIHLDVSYNRITSIAMSFKRFISLQHFNISHNCIKHIDDTLPIESLALIDISHNLIDFPILDDIRHLSNCSHLRILEIHDNVFNIVKKQRRSIDSHHPIEIQAERLRTNWKILINTQIPQLHQLDGIHFSTTNSVENDDNVKTEVVYTEDPMMLTSNSISVPINRRHSLPNNRRDSFPNVPIIDRINASVVTKNMPLNPVNTTRLPPLASDSKTIQSTDSVSDNLRNNSLTQISGEIHQKISTVSSDPSIESKDSDDDSAIVKVKASRAANPTKSGVKLNPTPKKSSDSTQEVALEVSEHLSRIPHVAISHASSLSHHVTPLPPIRHNVTGDVQNRQMEENKISKVPNLDNNLTGDVTASGETAVSTDNTTTLHSKIPTLRRDNRSDNPSIPTTVTTTTSTSIATLFPVINDNDVTALKPSDAFSKGTQNEVVQLKKIDEKQKSLKSPDTETQSILKSQQKSPTNDSGKTKKLFLNLEESDEAESINVKDSPIQKQLQSGTSKLSPVNTRKVYLNIDEDVGTDIQQQQPAVTITANQPLNQRVGRRVLDLQEITDEEQDQEQVNKKL